MTSPDPAPAPALDVAAIRARCEAATPGPWIWESEEGDGYMGCGSVYTMGEHVMGGDIAAPSGDCYPRSGYSPLEDMQFIAAARTDVPALLDALAAAQARAAELEAAATRTLTYELSLADIDWAEKAATAEQQRDNYVALYRAAEDEQNAAITRAEKAEIERDHHQMVARVWQGKYTEVAAKNMERLEACMALAERAEKAESAVARVEALHVSVGFRDGDWCAGCGGHFRWPCATVAALQGPPAEPASGQEAPDAR